MKVVERRDILGIVFDNTIISANFKTIFLKLLEDASPKKPEN